MDESQKKYVKETRPVVIAHDCNPKSWETAMSRSAWAVQWVPFKERQKGEKRRGRETNHERPCDQDSLDAGDGRGDCYSQGLSEGKCLAAYGHEGTSGFYGTFYAFILVVFTWLSVFVKIH